ncbi:DNA-binding transcriptional ArsR family regulator [Natranaerovirga hydrolytica]|uniref:DNA-binding transcriptional ArsR family regulator n=1 Tax=Natranaerovirga hydrolytica TaxID=680378 RepID=A0A4R1MM90_9FIRM|nr:winged helix-turn-helix domain-containing protein [Natranaerovirga hydrolytica]TCK93210.1 DNA-binding transcriptional ArsR family regulator [Natranaerovirga hydrolytica]
MKKKKIILGTDRPGEFIMSLVRIASVNGKEWTSEDEVKAFAEEYGIELDKDIQRFIQTVQSALDEKHKTLLDKYFAQSPFAIGLALIEDYQSVESFISKIKNLTHTELAYYLLVTWSEVHFGKEELESIMNKKNMISWVENNFSVSEKGKWQIMKIIYCPEEVKEELVEFFTYYYETFYKAIEEEIMIKLEQHIQSHKETLEKAFLQDYMDMLSVEGQESFWSSEEAVEVLVSYFIEIGSAYSSGGEGFVIGYRFNELVDKVFNREQELLKYTTLFKVLSDETRLKVLLQINEGSKYLAELAEIMESSTPAIKYHLNKLFLAGLIEVEHTDSRIYYQVKKEKFDQFTKDVQKVFLS